MLSAGEYAHINQKGLYRKTYPSELMDEQWAIVEPMILPAMQSPSGRGSCEIDMREALNGVVDRCPHAQRRSG